MREFKNRQPAVAGTFYPADSKKLKETVTELLKKSRRLFNNTIAVITPHAGYVFSGKIAAQAIAQLNPDKDYENIFLLGVSHHLFLKGASIYTAGDYLIPDGKIQVNTALATELTETYDFFEYNAEAHLHEHSIEVQLPFLYFHLKKKFKIVPILIGTKNLSTLKKIANALSPYFNEKNAFVVSSDFSHYPNYEDAVKIDKITANAILKNNPEEFYKTLLENETKEIPGLATSACGWANIMTLLYLTENKNFTYHIIDYQNSGDSSFGGKNKVVGYYAISLVKN